MLGTEIEIMRNLKKNKSKVRTTTAATTFLMVVITITIIVLISNLTIITPVADAVNSQLVDKTTPPEAPTVVSGDNIYISWWNGTAGLPDVQTDVMFRASTDGGATFSDKINLSNSSDADSWRVEVAGEGENVVVSWWETNQTSDIPVARVSTDAGETFGPMIMLATNGTISDTEEEGGEETTTASTERSLADPSQQSSLDQHDDLASITIIDRAGPPPEVDNEHAEQ